MPKPYSTKETTNQKGRRDTEFNLGEIFDIRPDLSHAEKDMIKRAYLFAQNAHEGMERFSGEPYLSHLFNTAKILAEMKMGATAIVAGFLHDSTEDAGVSSQKIEEEFGQDVTFLVEGVSKLGHFKYRGSDKNNESLRRLFIAMSKDIRVLIIKLADRLHNVRTLEFVKSEKRKRIALETIEIFAPLAGRLGIGKLRDNLESAAFPYAYPAEYELTKEVQKEKVSRDKEYLEKTNRTILKELAKNELADADVSYREKKPFSLYKKLIRPEIDWDGDLVTDIYAVRVIVETISDCYRVLGIVHSMWRPVPGKIKDYIALPKPNGYQSIHSSVYIGDGRIVEIQIRTKRMHLEAEYGIASHITYVESGKPCSGGSLSRKLAWVKQLLEWQRDFAGDKDFLENLKIDFFQYQIFVFTPVGDVVELPQDSSVIDFAYSIHSDIGNHAFGAKINGKFVSLDSKPKNGDTIEIITKRTSKPSQKWLGIAKTSFAKKHIRNFLSGKSK